MRSNRSLVCSLLLASLVALPAATARAAVIQLLYTEPPASTMPPFGSVPFPSNLYFDGGSKAAGDGTLINQDVGNPDGYEKFGIETVVLPSQDRALMAGLDRLDGFGVTTPVWFFFDGPVDRESLPGVDIVSNGRVQTSPSAADSVFLVEVGSSPAEFIPVKFHVDIDTFVANTLAVGLLEGTVLKPNTDYAAVVTSAIKGVGGKIVSTPDFEAAKGGALAAAMGYVTSSLGVAAGDVVGMTVFTTQTTTATLAAIRTGIVDACTPAVDFSAGLVFTADAFFGVGNAPNVGVAASGYYESPRLQSLDPTNHSHRDGSGGTSEADLPVGTLSEIYDEQFEDLGSNGAGCDLTVPGTPDGLPDVVDIDPSTPGTLDMAQVPVSLAVPAGPAPVGGWPVIIVQHGLGGHRSTTMALADVAAAQGFAVIGIDAVDHGLRWDETDNLVNFTGAPGPDGLPDGSLGNAVNFGFFEAFSSLAPIRDNFRQTYVDIMALVRALSVDAFDTVPGVDLDPSNIYYVGLSLGGLVGAGSTPYIPEVRAVVLDAAGGQLSTELFTNSTIGSGAFPLLQSIFGLDPDNTIADYAFFSALTQHILDAGDGAVSAPHFFNDPFGSPFRAMNVILFEDMDDSVVPNQANEAIAVAGGFDLFDPHVQNLVETVRPIPVAATSGYVEGNVAGTTTAAVFQVGPAVHAVLEEGVATIALVPGFAHIDEFRNANLATSFVPLMRPIRIKYPSVLPDIFDWFNDIVANGEPGRFTYTGAELNHNSVESQYVGEGTVTYTFFDRTLNADGVSPYAEPTPNAAVTVVKSKQTGRVTMARSTLGATLDGANADAPPLATLATPNVLPFFVSVQRPEAPGYEGTGLTIEYTDDELAASGCVESELFVARYNQLSSAYDALPTSIDATANTATVTGFQGADGVYAVLCDGSGLAFNEHIIGKKAKFSFSDDPGKPQKGLVAGSIVDPTNTLVIDPTTGDIDVVVWEDRNTILVQETLSMDCWTAKSSTKWQYDPTACVTPGPFKSAKLSKSTGGGVTTYKVSIKLEGALAIDTVTEGGGGTQLQLTINGVSRNTSGGRCKNKATKITCSKYD